VTNPAILLADEPTGNLDSRTSEEIMGIFQQLNDDGKTVVLITHEADIAQYAKRIVNMRDGQIQHDARNAQKHPGLSQPEGTGASVARDTPPRSLAEPALSERAARVEGLRMTKEQP
jgi:energy-coupling factor transporter ATP-binding protein EcfA2